MTKYQKVAQLKRAVKNEITKRKSVSVDKPAPKLPEYITKNPWY